MAKKKKRNIISLPVACQRTVPLTIIKYQSVKKNHKVEKDRARLLFKLDSNDLSSIITRVAFILNHYKDTRNSDKALALKYWEIFQNDIYRGAYITAEQYYDLEPQNNITRARQKIQNEFKLFLADDKIQRFRRSRAEIEKETQLSIKPPIPVTTISCDESGKNDTFVLVGSLWSINPERYGNLRNRINLWRKEKELKPKDEFHFTELKKHQVEQYKEFFSLVLRQSDTISFKAIAVRRDSSKRKIDEIITELYNFLIINGLTHEVNNGRVSVPRILNIYKDLEDGKDRLTLEGQKHSLQEKVKIQFSDQVELPLFESIQSYTNPFIQIADLFTGAVARKLNYPDGTNQKDELAYFILSSLGVDPKTFEVNGNSDSVHIETL